MSGERPYLPPRGDGPRQSRIVFATRRLRLAAGFTLVEVVVVIAILAALIALLLPAVNAARAARGTECLSNLREIGLATQIYVSTNGTYPPAWVSDTCRWMDLIKPDIDKSSTVYRCPSDTQQIPSPYDPTITLSYGINCFLFKDQAHCFWYTVDCANVARTSAVILYADCTPGNYWCGGGGAFSDPVVGVDYRHASGTFNAVFCDGHAEPKTSTTQADWDASQ